MLATGEGGGVMNGTRGAPMHRGWLTGIARDGAQHCGGKGLPVIKTLRREERGDCVGGGERVILRIRGGDLMTPVSGCPF